MLEKFIAHHNTARRSFIVSLTTIGEIGERINNLGVSVVSLNINSPVSAVIGLLRFARLIHKHKPDTVIAWMYHANLVVALFSIIFPKPYTVWNIRCGISQYLLGNLSKRILLRISRTLSRVPDKIIFNNKRSMKEHITFGFYKKNCHVVYNGFELRKASSLMKKIIRKQIGINENVFLIGSFGRNIPLKRMDDILVICAKLRESGCPAEILYVGRNFDSVEFKEKIRKHGINKKVHVVQEVPSLDPYYSAIDAFGLCSENEGFPNVIGEAVFCEVPVFCTDVGDMKNDFLNSWQVSPVGDVQSLTETAFRLFCMGPPGRRKLAKEQLFHFRKKTEINQIVRELDRLFLPRKTIHEN